MNLAEYMKNECEKATLNENTSQLGYTDVFSGSNWMGPHRHDYVIWNEFGYGYTSDAIAAPDCQGQASVGARIARWCANFRLSRCQPGPPKEFSHVDCRKPGQGRRLSQTDGCLRASCGTLRRRSRAVR